MFVVNYCCYYVFVVNIIMSYMTCLIIVVGIYMFICYIIMPYMTRLIIVVGIYVCC